MGRKRRGRSVNGVLLLNKPQGMTSNRFLQIVRRHYQAAKAGHTGSLDPLATGLLPICFGEATKFSHFMLNADKSYRVTARLGQKTDSADADGEIIATCEVSVTNDQFYRVLKQFEGDILQVPSMFSALKKDGQPLYKLARQGITVEREARPVTIYNIDCLELTDNTFSLEVACSKGTYIRNLIDDIGDSLGCGAHVIQLERLSSGHFTSQQWYQWDEIEQQTDFTRLDEYLLPVDALIPDLPEVRLSVDEAHYMRHGQAIFMSGLSGHELFRLYTTDNQFMGIAHINDEGMLAPKRLLVS